MSGAAAPRQATGMADDALAACLDGDPAASRQDALVSERSGLLDLADGMAIVIPGADLVQRANLRYEGPDPDADPDTISAARYALDMYWYRAGEARRIGGERARGMHYVLCRYLLPFLLEHRARAGRCRQHSSASATSPRSCRCSPASGRCRPRRSRPTG